MSSKESNKVSISKILDQTFSLFFKQFIWIFIIGLIFVSLPSLMGSWETIKDPLQTTKTPEVKILVGIVSWLLGILLAGVAIIICRDWRDKGKISWTRAFGETLRRYHILLLGSILIGLAVILGFMCLIIPGIILALTVCCFLPVMCIEKCSISTCWHRCFELVKGHRWHILLLYSVSYIIIWIITVVPMTLLFFVPSQSILQTMAIIASLASAIVWPLLHMVSTFLYFELREKKEGLDLEELSDQMETVEI